MGRKMTMSWTKKRNGKKDEEDIKILSQQWSEKIMDFFNY